MKNPITVSDAISLLNRTSLPSVMTEGSDDYRVMRRIEERLSDIGVDFIPLGGKRNVLEVWSGIDDTVKKNCLGIVDLDLWVLNGIPLEYQSASLVFTMGYSIENDLYSDSKISKLLNESEKNEMLSDIDTVAAWHAKEITKAMSGLDYKISQHPNEILSIGDISPSLNQSELSLKSIIKTNFGQILRGKTLLELMARQLNKKDRHVKFSYKQIYEIAAADTGAIFNELESRIRSYFT